MAELIGASLEEGKKACEEINNCESGERGSGTWEASCMDCSACKCAKSITTIAGATTCCQRQVDKLTFRNKAMNKNISMHLLSLCVGIMVGLALAVLIHTSSSKERERKLEVAINRSILQSSANTFGLICSIVNQMQHNRIDKAKHMLSIYIATHADNLWTLSRKLNDPEFESRMQNEVIAGVRELDRSLLASSLADVPGLLAGSTLTNSWREIFEKLNITN